ncbi:MAG: excinuclease ABC subunit UvrC [Candidatus Eremiobacteraeota bacterium]|nr:excinuclease ABC subunit UvrC [Candidatus Eremiobacteraeota bacterium]
MSALQISEKLQEQLDRLPSEPGIYQMLDQAGKALYVGKAVDLRNRVRSYFQPGRPRSTRGDALVEQVAELRTIIVKSEAEALLLEANLIKQHKPPFNVRLKDDKKYPYLKVTLNEMFPRVIFTRKLERDGSKYFGPYSNAGALRDSIDLIRKVFPLRTCKEDIGKVYRRPCLQYHIKRCMAPCAFLQSKAEYDATVRDVLLFLEGRHSVLVDKLKREMEFAAEQLAFEHAARLRDRINDLERVMARQEVVWKSQIDMDLIAGAHGQGVSSLEVFFVRGGKLLGQEHFIVEGTEGRSPDEVLGEFVKQFYAQSPTVPKEVMLEVRIPDMASLDRALSEVRGNRVRILVPERGQRAEYMRKVKRNAEQHLADHLSKVDVARERTTMALEELAAALGLPGLPQRIECYDISHVQGTNVVGSMVVFENGKPAKGEYRRFKIQGDERNDDFANMQQMLRRRLRYISPDDTQPKQLGREKKFAKRPGLLLIDGGRGQLNAVYDVLQELDLIALPVAALAKQFEELYALDEPAPVFLPRNSAALHLVQRIRDEAHRFAVTYHRGLRSKAAVRSALDGLPGVGPARRKALVDAFGSVAGVRRASVAELEAVSGISHGLATTIREALDKEAV